MWWKLLLQFSWESAMKGWNRGCRNCLHPQGEMLTHRTSTMLLESSFLHTQATSLYLGTTIKAKRGTKGQRRGKDVSPVCVACSH